MSMEHPDHDTGCLLCGEELVYLPVARQQQCAVCHQTFTAAVQCKNGHYVCDGCHAAGAKGALLRLLSHTRETDPVALFLQAAELPGVHLHGPEHHTMVACVLLTAYARCGGSIDLPRALTEAMRRSAQVPGGSCGYWGVCGAAVGAGIYASVIQQDNPLNDGPWGRSMALSSRCLSAISRVGGVRCCKRTVRLSIEEAVSWTKEVTGVAMPLSRPGCTYCGQNRECIRERCPFWGEPKPVASRTE